MKIEQFKDAPLAHYSYAIISDGKMAVVDPSRNPLQYYLFAEANKAEIVAVLETHPHADFVSSHKQIHEQTGAPVYTSRLVGAEYSCTSFDEGDSFTMGRVIFRAINTPGHSPDSITIIAESGGKTALFTGDTLFVGDVGRPDLRENVGNMRAQRVSLAKDMYASIRTKFSDLPNESLVYPAHGAGSLCGKNMSSEPVSTLGRERKYNWAFKDQPESEFIETILRDQPFIPHYFGFNVDLNRAGAEHVQQTKASVPLLLGASETVPGVLVVDTRNDRNFKKGHLPGSINIMARDDKDKFETWLGAIVKPGEHLYLVIEGISHLRKILERVAKIGYEKQIKAVISLGQSPAAVTPELNLKEFRKTPNSFTILDVRNEGEVKQRKIFENALHIPLYELRERIDEIPSQKPVVVHCAGGFRSAAGSGIVQRAKPGVKVYDLGEDIRKF